MAVSVRRPGDALGSIQEVRRDELADAQAQEEAAKRQVDALAEKQRLAKARAETAWAWKHLYSVPRNKWGLGYWENETTPLTSKPEGWASPFSNTYFEERQKNAILANNVRENVGDAFRRGASDEEIIAYLNTVQSVVPRDIAEHWGTPYRPGESSSQEDVIKTWLHPPTPVLDAAASLFRTLLSK